MADYLIPLTCLACGADCESEAAGRPVQAGSRVGAVVRCSECRRGWLIVVQILQADVAESRDGLITTPPKGSRVQVECRVCGVSMPKYPRPGKGGKARVTCGPECAKANWSAQSRARAAERAS